MRTRQRSRKWGIITAVAALGLALVAAAPLFGMEPLLRRGEPQRDGRTWVELSACGAGVPDGGKLVLRASFGAVMVRAVGSVRLTCQVRLTAYTPDEGEARRLFRSYDLSFRMTGPVVTLTGRAPLEGRGANRLSAEYDLVVPVRYNLDIVTQGGEIMVDRLDGELRATTAGGDIRTGDVRGPVHLETAGGNIAVGDTGQPLEAHTAGGFVRVGDVNGGATIETQGGEIYAGQIAGSFRAQTAGGDILLEGASGPVIVGTAGGHIQLGDCGATVRAETAGGNIRLQGARGPVRAETAGGSIDLFQLQSAVEAQTAAGRILAEISASPKTFTTSHLQTSVGDVQVYLPPDLPFTIDALIDEAAGHKIYSDFPLTLVGQRMEFPPSTVRGQGELNGGGKELRIHTIMGNIEIRKLDAQTLNLLRQRQAVYWRNWQLLEQRQLLQMQEKLRELQQTQHEEMRRQDKILREQMKELEMQLQQQPDPKD